MAYSLWQSANCAGFGSQFIKNGCWSVDLRGAHTTFCPFWKWHINYYALCSLRRIFIVIKLLNPTYKIVMLFQDYQLLLLFIFRNYLWWKETHGNVAAILLVLKNLLALVDLSIKSIT